MNEPRDDLRPDESELEDWLAGESPLSRRYADLGDEQPPPELDRKILTSAAEASKVVPLERTTRRWGASIAVAATVLLCVSIVVNLSIQPDGPLLGEAPPQVEFAGEPAPAREAAADDDLAGDKGRLDELRRRSTPAMPPPAAVEEPLIGPTALESAPLERRSAAEPAAPYRESLDAGIDSAAVRPSLDRPLAMEADSARDDEQLARAIELLQARREADRAEPMTRAGNQRKAGTLPEPEDQLNAILAAWDADDPDLAWFRLQAFLRDYPEHPFSRELTGQK